MSDNLTKINFRQFPSPPDQSRCCLTDILSIRQQQQATSSMTGIESDKPLGKDEVCQCDICTSQDVETIEGSHLAAQSAGTSSQDTPNPPEKFRKPVTPPKPAEGEAISLSADMRLKNKNTRN